MASLTKKEIEAQLKNLGIDSHSEKRTYFNDYKAYCNIHNTKKISPHILSEVKAVTAQTGSKLNRAWLSMFSVVTGILALSRVKTYKRVDR